MKDIKLIILDVDGVLTDGSISYSSNDEEIKSFNVKDGMGIGLGRYAGLKFAIITGRRSHAVTKRARELNIDFVYQGVKNKVEILMQLMNTLNIDRDAICFMGDDINDYHLLKEVGLSFSPKDAVELIKDSVDMVTNKNGGDGAVREMIDTILYSQFDYQKLVIDFLEKQKAITQ